MASRGRPLVPDEDLLHPRKVWVRKNVLKGERLTDKPPSKALQAMYGGWVQQAIIGVLSQPSRHNNIAKKNKIDITFPKKHKTPEGWPVGRFVEELDGLVTKRYNCEQIVLWAFQWNYCKWMPSDLYSMRRSVMLDLGNMEKELDIDQSEAYNLVIDDNKGEENEHI